MSNRVTDSLQKAAASIATQATGSGSFQRGDVAPAEQATITKADAAGLSAPPPSTAEMAGINANATLARRYLAELERFDLYRQAKKTIEHEHDDALWAAYQSRATA
jgi:hypothetical protein